MSRFLYAFMICMFASIVTIAVLGAIVSLWTIIALGIMWGGSIMMLISYFREASNG